MYFLYIEVDSNDADYIGRFYQIDEETLECVQKWMQQKELTEDDEEIIYDLMPRMDTYFEEPLDRITCMRVVLGEEITKQLS